MKKSLLKIASVVIAAALSLGALASCGLFAVDSDRDMAQTVVTIRINETVEATEISKRDLVSGYLSYGYNYVQNYSYTVSEAYKLVLDNLVNSAVIVQQSRSELAQKASTDAYKDALPTAEERATTINNLYNDGYLYLFASKKEIADFEKTDAGKENKAFTAKYSEALNKYIYDLYKDKTDFNANYDAFTFLSEKDAYSAIATAIDSANSLMEAFVKSSDDEEEYENITYTARTTPTMDEEEEDDEELLKEYKAKKIDLSGDKSTSLGKAKDRILDLNLIDKDESVDSRETKYILAYSYFKRIITSSAESAIVSVYEQALKNESNKVDYNKASDDKKGAILDNLWEQYKALQNKQQAEYDGNVSSFETQLGAVSDSSFVVYTPSAGYFYVSHFLVGYSDEQKALVEKKTGEKDVTEENIQDYADSLASTMVIEDQRASWVLSGYGTYDAKDFVFSDKYVYDTEGELVYFQGEVGGVKTYKTKDDDGNDVNNFAFSSVKASKMPYSDFTKLAAKYITGANGDIALNTVYDGTASAGKIGKDQFERFEDLKFAFSTDTGNFNNYLGYAYSPITSKSQYVSAFSKACEEIAELENKVGAYKMFMSKEYGLHIVLCTASADYGIYADKDAFKNALSDEESVAYLFMKAQIDLITDNYINDIAQSFINEYTAENAKIKGTDKLIVTYNEKAYDDLITEE